MAKDIVVTTPEQIARRGHLVGTVLRPALEEGRTVYARAEALAAAAEWLTFAGDDVTLARAGLTRRQIFQPQQVCLHAQEAAEKAIKGLCVADQVEFPFSHDLVRLTQLLRRGR